jgi:hypothetical protein
VANRWADRRGEGRVAEPARLPHDWRCEGIFRGFDPAASALAANHSFAIEIKRLRDSALEVAARLPPVSETPDDPKLQRRHALCASGPSS